MCDRLKDPPYKILTEVIFQGGSQTPPSSSAISPMTKYLHYMRQNCKKKKTEVCEILPKIHNLNLIRRKEQANPN
jgi:hypothetical protein